MEGYTPSLTNQTCSGPEESNGVRLVDQDVSADYKIESLLGRKGFNRRLFKANLSQSGRTSPFCSQSENFPIAINSHHQSCWSDELGSQHRNIAGTTAQVEDTHTWADVHSP
jgi:hypothetical protein